MAQSDRSRHRPRDAGRGLYAAPRRNRHLRQPVAGAWAVSGIGESGRDAFDGPRRRGRLPLLLPPGRAAGDRLCRARAGPAQPEAHQYQPLS